MTNTTRASRRTVPRVHPSVWPLILLVVIGGGVLLVYQQFLGNFRSYVRVTLLADRAGLVMEHGGQVNMRGIQVGRVDTTRDVGGHTSLSLQIFPDQVEHIPANVEGQIRASTVFGAKYVDLVYPKNPSPRPIAAGEVIRAQNVSTEVNTVFQNLSEVLHSIDPVKLNATLTAVAEGLRGKAPAIGQSITAGYNVLTALNPRAETIRSDWQSLKGFSNTYSAAAQNILAVLDAASTTSTTITDDAASLDQLLTSIIGVSRSGINLIGPNRDNLVDAINDLEPTMSLLMKYNPELTCMLTGAKLLMDTGYAETIGGNGRSAILDAALLLGDDPYRYPDNLPIIGARGGPGGKPSCGSLPDVAKNWPVRHLVTDTGFGTGLDIRPNPGIGFPGWANYFPVTRGTPEPPNIRSFGGPAPGPIPYPGAPPYGAPMYAPDGTPMYPGLPPAPPPGAPRDLGPRPGAEPFLPPHPMEMQPTPTPPAPQAAAPSP
ncbi:MCE family protein [Mycobacterium vicinigordonae]|uniref:MCE family protein n=1 Tax=Mycobacterium vicinigordonae TaxID=1719132 RepID=A0A7D6HWL3_9MYCO|nr:MCE family protein [Mycobacterium vicinigordonae]QLL06255.1 MCE family protein [Mycobacterium vicinigordonae]